MSALGVLEITNFLNKLTDEQIIGFNKGEYKIVPVEKPKILEKVAEIKIPAIRRFNASKKFKIDPPYGRVQIYSLQDSFKNIFLNKIEDPIASSSLKIYKNLVPFPDQETIIAEIGDSNETTLGQLYYLMSLQPRGEEGRLLTNGTANIFYIRSISKDLECVVVNWFGSGWNLGAYSITCTHCTWHAGRQIFCR